MAVLSFFQAQSLISERRNGALSCQSTLDLGITFLNAELRADSVRYEDGTTISWEIIEMIADTSKKCFWVEDDIADEIQIFSPTTKLLRSLYPTSSAPSMMVSGIIMHRIKDVDPIEDTLRKIETLKPIYGKLLDTATGLGYTAIEAEKRGAFVTTIEIDPSGLEIARLNPWSQALFNNPRIEQIIGDSFDVIKNIPDGAFSRILHDPPTFSLAGHLYSGEFYSHCCRCLSKGGMMFHYVGDPDAGISKRVLPGVIKRLHAAGFSKVIKRPKAFGVLAVK